MTHDNSFTGKKYNSVTGSILSYCLKCLNCMFGYAFGSSNNCALCSSFAAISNCQTCSSNTTCLTCLTTDYAINPTAKCALCSSFAAIPNCQTCSSNTTCLTCSARYFLESNVCLKCNDRMSYCNMC